MTATAIRFNSPAERHAYEVGLKLIADRLEADRQKRAFAGIDTAAIVRSAAAEAVAGLRRLKAKQAAVKLAKPSPHPAQVKPASTVHRFEVRRICSGPIFG